MRFLFDRRKVAIGLCCLGLVALLLIANPTQAAVNKYWDAEGTTDSLGEAANWDGDTLPGLDDVNFDDTGAARLTPDTAGSDYTYRYLKFPASSTEYTIGSIGDSIKVSKINANHVGITQTINCEIICTSTYNLRTAGTIEMHTFGDDNLSSYVTFTNNENHADSVTKIQHLKGGSIRYYSPGLLELTGDSGTTGSNWDGKLNIKSNSATYTEGVVRISHNNALGTTAAITDIEGGNGNHGTLEVTNNITVPENFDLRGREAGGSITDNDLAVHVSNVSGDNTLTGNFNLTGSGWNCRIASEGGTLDLTGNITNVRTDEARYLFLQGASDGTMSGVISDGAGEDEKEIALYKEGAGTWTLSGANTYTSDTTVSEGTLCVAGSIMSDTTVKDGATLGGSGLVDADLTGEPGSTIKTGCSIGTLTVTGAATLGGALQIEYDGDAESIDLLDVGGNLDITGATVDFVDLGGGAPLDEPVYVFAKYGGTLTGTFAGDPTPPPGFTIDYAYGGDSIALIPEPATLVLLAGFLMGVLLVRRHK